jgi:hypothetical protein
VVGGGRTGVRVPVQEVKEQVPSAKSGLRSEESGFRKYKCSGKVGGDRLHGKEGEGGVASDRRVMPRYESAGRGFSPAVRRARE